MLLLSVDQRLSMTEMCERTGLKSTNTIANRLKNLEKLGYINPPRRFRLARSRTLTSQAVQVLKANGHQVNTRDSGFTSNFQR
jgi:SOS-response transcriptional repressor LexA